MFEFRGSGFGYIWLLIMIISAITLGLYISWAYCKMKRWEVKNTTYATRWKKSRV